MTPCHPAWLRGGHEGSPSDSGLPSTLHPEHEVADVHVQKVVDPQPSDPIGIDLGPRQGRLSFVSTDPE